MTESNQDRFTDINIPEGEPLEPIDGVQPDDPAYLLALSKKWGFTVEVDFDNSEDGEA